jgi:hypothetical protein
VGIFLEQLLSPLDRWLPEWSRMPAGDRWAKAWQVRWQSAGCDAEFKRYEALVSFGRAYTFHFLIGTALWPALLVRQDDAEMAAIAVFLGIVLTSLTFLGWRRQLRRIITVVNSAAVWTPEASATLSGINGRSD